MNYKKDFPLDLSGTKKDGLTQKFNLSNIEERKNYFEAKAGEEIGRLKKHFENNTFIAYWLGKKMLAKALIPS